MAVEVADERNCSLVTHWPPWYRSGQHTPVSLATLILYTLEMTTKHITSSLSFYTRYTTVYHQCPGTHDFKNTSHQHYTESHLKPLISSLSTSSQLNSPLADKHERKEDMERMAGKIVTGVFKRGTVTG
ncbi:hypothetical protein E2C01_023716 [Portunus trituberculatus]|uniref:Uncharacterized protein n=1 Tax=Portunus trituberculatus TaxID=210409 RepID=A0A5B7E8N6_PORTR|nr:hypothetical protein [Portunus trituberculatus]